MKCPDCAGVGEIPIGPKCREAEVCSSCGGSGEQSTEPLQFVVRTGLGGLTYGKKYGTRFTDRVETVSRKPRFNVGWQAVTYKRKRYQLLGGVRTPYFICLNSPIPERW